MPQLNHVVWGNTVIVWMVAVAGALALLGLLQGTRWAVLRYLGRHGAAAPRDRFLLMFSRGLQPLLLAVLSLSVASQLLTLPDRADRLLAHAGPLAVLAQVALWGHVLIAFYLDEPFQEARLQDPLAATRASVLSFLLRLVLGSLVLLAALGLLGYNITALLASLGIGGIAVALAVQNVLGDVFASLSIALDKPFIVGDFIVVDDFVGVVDYVGLKTTRVHSLSGEQIVFSNSDLLKSRIRNFKRMLERRVLFTFALAWDTPPERLEALPEHLRRIIEDQAGTRFDRAHLKEFRDATFVYEIVFYVLSADYNQYMDIQQAINFALLRLLQAEGLALAAPKRCVALVEP